MVGYTEFVSVTLDGNTIVGFIAQPGVRKYVAVFRRRHNALNVGVHVPGKVSRVRQRTYAHFRVLAEEIRWQITRDNIRFTMLRRRAENKYRAQPVHHIQQELIQLVANRLRELAGDVFGVYVLNEVVEACSGTAPLE